MPDNQNVQTTTSVLDKSLLTNVFSLLIVITGLVLEPSKVQQLILYTGLFALSGGLTNWLAIHMLFEKIPGLYGSGVIPERFEDFKAGIKQLIMREFFNKENLQKFFEQMNSSETTLNSAESPLGRMVEAVDLEAAYHSLVEVIMSSSFGSMLSMFGGVDALEPLKEPFVEKMKEFMVKVGEDPDFMQELHHTTSNALLERIEKIVERRLEELTPQLVKEIVQQMIRQHLGWLVVWGGVFGGLIGLISALLLS